MNPLPASSFGERIVRWNRLDAAGFVAWDLLPGMRFGERAAWWRSGAGRAAPHEGLDLWRFRTRDGRLLALGAGALVPALWGGAVAALADDFLGRSVFLAHEWTDAAGRRLHSVYGHLSPRAGLAVGARIPDGGEVGKVADPAGRRTSAPAHLHLSLAFVAAGETRLGWGTLGDVSRANLVDPLPVVLGGGG